MSLTLLKALTCKVYRLLDEDQSRLPLPQLGLMAFKAADAVKVLCELSLLHFQLGVTHKFGKLVTDQLNLRFSIARAKDCPSPLAPETLRFLDESLIYHFHGERLIWTMMKKELSEAYTKEHAQASQHWQNRELDGQDLATVILSAVSLSLDSSTPWLLAEDLYHKEYIAGRDACKREPAGSGHGSADEELDTSIDRQNRPATCQVVEQASLSPSAHSRARNVDPTISVPHANTVNIEADSTPVDPSIRRRMISFSALDTMATNDAG
ncbi:uncharacterized protein KY384_002858 [Bacidia gigantensis]|uniref:uncharacterized protein n=1 Tax=Bacidia gigantensis TaxID=2732470 RepID=UPI001D052591|nr:uncharacterized protein KY384_002858 [Bacidia gigantensis]KAG8532373.1 hypothetical protein KY384_002858 [Bacidia gigantensis]